MLDYSYHTDYTLKVYRGLSVIRPQLGNDGDPVATTIAAFCEAAESERYEELKELAALLAMPLAEEGLDDGRIHSSALGGSMSLTILDRGCGCREHTGVPAEKLERALELVGMQLFRARA